MAKVLATVSGTAIKPGISRNRRLYSPDAVARAVGKAQARLAEGSMPLSMRSHHAAEDDSTRIVGRITSLSLAEDGSARFTADIADTPHGRTIASLLDTSGGTEPFLSGVSIRGAWDGKVRRVKGPDGEPVETGDDLTLHGLDYTATPGVPGASVDTFAWASESTSETTERVLITESVQEARVTITEETAPATEAAPPGVPEGVREALRAVFGAAAVAVTEADTPPMSKRDSGLSGAGKVWADPGYQADKKQRYDLSSKDKAKSAWAYINQAKNAKPYTANQLKRIKGRIKAALKKFGVTVATEGWTIEPALQLTEAVTEFMGYDPECAGSYSLTASNGPTTVTVCGYGLDPADLAVILQKACDGAGMALCALDPDMDGDIDVPGADAEDTDGDMASGDDDSGMDDNGDGVEDLVSRLMAAIRGESTEDIGDVVAEARNAGQVSETGAAASQDPAPDAGPQTREEPAVSGATTTEAVAETTAAAIPQDVLDAAVAKALAADKAARKARKAAKAKASESAPAAPVAEAKAETEDERIARLVEAKLAEAGVTETEEQRVERLVNERLVQEKQGVVAAGGGPGRKGLVTEHSAARTADGEIPADFPIKDGVMVPMEKWTEANRRAVSDAVQHHVLGARADV